MIIHVSTNNKGSKPIRLQFKDESIYIALGDIIGASNVKKCQFIE